MTTEKRRLPFGRHLLRLIPRSDQRELIAADLTEELWERITNGTPRARLWYLGAALESVADWWLGSVVRGSRGVRRDGRSRFRPAFRSGGLLSDVRFALRMIRRERVFSAAVIFTVLIGVSSTAAVVTLLRGVVLRPLPYPDPDAIVRISRGSDGQPAEYPVVGLPDLEDWRDRSAVFTEIAGWSTGGATLTGEGEAERVTVARVTDGFHSVLGITPARGRFFVDEELLPGGAPVAVVSDAFWRGRLGGDPNVLHRTLLLDGEPVQVVGLLPPSDFDYPPNAQLWVPLAPPTDSWMRTFRGASWLNAVGRVSSGVSPEAAEVELSRIQSALVSEFPRDNGGQDQVHLESLKDIAIAPAKPAILMMTVAVGLVLVLASINVGLLLLSRSNRRRRELAVRTALGGDRGRVSRLLVTEMLVLSVIGGLAGLPLALPLIDLMVSLYPGGLPRAAEVHLDAGVVLASLGVMVTAGLLASLAPAAGLRMVDLASQLRLRDGGTRQQGNARNVLVGIQIAFSALLLIGATLFARTLLNLRDSDPGFEPEHVLSFDVAPAESRYATLEEVTTFYRTLFDELETKPGVVNASGVNFLPFTIGDWGGGFDVDGDTHEARVRISWPTYHDAIGQEVLVGRGFDWRDAKDGAQVAALNESAARLAFDGEEALGRTVVFDGEPREIVGVVADIRHGNLTEAAAPEVHVPATQYLSRSASIALRTRGDPLAVLPAVREVVRQLDPAIPLTSIATMGERIERSIAPQRFRAVLAAALGGLAALLAFIGVYGVTSQAAAQRQKEIGIRFALGEGRGSIQRRVLVTALRVALFGVSAGVLVALAAGRTVASLLYDVGGLDPWAFLGIPALLIAATTLSALGPAIRASRLDPLATIREE